MLSGNIQNDIWDFFLKQKCINNKERKQQQQNVKAERQLEADTLEVNTKSEVGKFAKQPNLGLFLCDNLEQGTWSVSESKVAFKRGELVAS